MQQYYNLIMVHIDVVKGIDRKLSSKRTMELQKKNYCSIFVHLFTEKIHTQLHYGYIQPFSMYSLIKIQPGFISSITTF
jgi:hypothetical protein